MSSSSSMCDFDEFYTYHPLRNYQEPWYDYYQTMGHPLIYYAEVQPSSRRSRSGVRKDPNFFVKAFRWYTQEHQPTLQDRGREKVVTNPDLSGFANWLDAKYGQYIQEGQREQINEFSVPEPQKPKKLLATMKSHFTRRQKIKKDGARQKRSCNSCEYIMKPKDMSLTGSDYKRSNVKALCSDTQEKKSTMKSASMNSSRYDVDYQKSIEIVVTEGDVNDKPEDNRSCAKTEVLTIYESKPNNKNNVCIRPLPCDPPDVDSLCECEKPAKVDAYTQYDKNMDIRISPVTAAPPVPSKNKVEIQDNNKASNINHSVTSITKKTSNPRKPPKTSDISCLCSLEHVASSRPTKSAKRSESKCTASDQDAAKVVLHKNVATDAIVFCSCVTPPTPTTLPTPIVPPVVPPPPSAPVVTPAPADTGCVCSIRRVNETMQTSDTSICLDDEVIKYPFFMKIVRADKLSTNC